MEDIAPPPPPPPSQPEPHTPEPEEITNEISVVAEEKHVNEYHQSSEVTNQINESHNSQEEEEEREETAVTEPSLAVVEPTHDPYTPRVLDDNCGADNGGCDQKCERVLYPGENEPRIRCSCSQGFSLDPYDYSTCHGKSSVVLFLFVNVNE